MKPDLRRAGALITAGAAVRALDGVAPVAPLKGALIELTAAPGRLARAADVDLLVPEDRFDDAERALWEAGFRRVARDRDDRARTFGGPFPVAVDLHRRLFKRGLFRMPTSDLFRRAREDRTHFSGSPVHLLDPRDAYAHAVGHAAGAPTVGSVATLPGDLAALVRHHRLQPTAVASHLRALGLRRAARFALGGLADDFSRAVLRALPMDPVGALVSGVIRWRVGDPSDPRARVGAGPGLAIRRALAVHALNDTLPRAALSVAAHLVQGAHQRIAGEPQASSVSP